MSSAYFCHYEVLFSLLQVISFEWKEERVKAYLSSSIDGGAFFEK